MLSWWYVCRPHRRIVNEMDSCSTSTHKLKSEHGIPGSASRVPREKSGRVPDACGDLCVEYTSDPWGTVHSTSVSFFLFFFFFFFFFFGSLGVSYRDRGKKTNITEYSTLNREAFLFTIVRRNVNSIADESICWDRSWVRTFGSIGAQYSLRRLDDHRRQ
ncbi:hypothetical protein GGR52DRAFT_512732 [Hypoxylon sp. FL1284]|nr:hypothetical protein GGR52DRAFT_512732 [Hypoxylon sp. FL1284]